MTFLRYCVKLTCSQLLLRVDNIIRAAPRRRERM